MKKFLFLTSLHFTILDCIFMWTRLPNGYKTEFYFSLATLLLNFFVFGHFTTVTSRGANHF